MDKEWSAKNKKMQELLKKEESFNEGISLLIELREVIFKQITQILNNYPQEAFYQMPFPNSRGFHSKTINYSIWHIFRIEDIVAHELIANDEQILFRKGYANKIHSPITTTGNELIGNEIIEFSKCLDRWQLYYYAKDVLTSTNQILLNLKYSDLKKTFNDDYKIKIMNSNSVSKNENAVWLIDYWCNKNIMGLIKMPLSRHHIMHVEAIRRIKNKLCLQARKHVDPIAYCGFSCNHCFLSEWCGSCRTNYNVCSFATCSSNGICPNVICCKQKGYDGCYECDEIMECNIGFYSPDVDGSYAAKAQALYIKKYGKKQFLQVHDRLHEKYSFSKTQEILGHDVLEGLKILEDN